LFLLAADSVTALGLLTKKKFGEYGFLIIATAQLVAYVGFADLFGKQTFLTTFHILTVAIYLCLKVKIKFEYKSKKNL
jgi:hypothetical protein